MADLPACLVLSLLPIRPQVGSTNTGMGNSNHGVSWCENGRIRDLLHLDSKCSTKHGCTHVFSPFSSLLLVSQEDLRLEPLHRWVQTLGIQLHHLCEELQLR